jgi:hypothetical protein
MDELKIFYDEVARVAYDLYEKRGKIHGHDREDWLKAEMIVKKRYAEGNRTRAGAAKQPGRT